MDTHTHFHYLQQKLQEWKANDLLFPPLQLSWMRFQEVATRDILPVLHEARAILEAEGLDVSITDLDEETRSLGLYVKDVGMFFTANDDARTIHLTARRLSAEEPGYESRLRYEGASGDALRRLVEETLLRLLGPRRATPVNQ
ncbi:MAG: hypothetical protein KF890_03900 [Nitrospira sp.]|nr:hypothetical protein [Nitrospira sp.]